jgi:hypothetical protein
MPSSHGRACSLNRLVGAGATQSDLERLAHDVLGIRDTDAPSPETMDRDVMTDQPAARTPVHHLQ